MYILSIKLSNHSLNKFDNFELEMYNQISKRHLKLHNHQKKYITFLRGFGYFLKGWYYYVIQGLFRGLRLFPFTLKHRSSKGPLAFMSYQHVFKLKTKEISNFLFQTKQKQVKIRTEGPFLIQKIWSNIIR